MGGKRTRPLLWKYHCLLAEALARLNALLRVARVVVAVDLVRNVHKIDQIGEDHKDKVAQNAHVKPEHEQIHREDVIVCNCASPMVRLNTEKSKSTSKFQGYTSSEKARDVVQKPGCFEAPGRQIRTESIQK